MNTITKVFVGVDVSKDTLDIHLNPIGKSFKINNSQKGIIGLIDELSQYEIGQVVCESSGGYERLMTKILKGFGYAVWVIEPARIKAFIASEGIKFKNDPHDAKMLALFASQKQCAYEAHNPSEAEIELRNWVKRRTDLVNIKLMEKKRLQSPAQAYCAKEIKQHIKFLDKQISNIDKIFLDLIGQDEVLNKRATIINSIPGLGAVTTASLIADVPELGALENKEAAALLGVAPYTQQSGKSKGIAYIKCGRFEPRRKFYMAVLVAIRFNPVIQAFYNKLIAAGKKPKVALIAAANKLIRIVNAMLKNETLWNENYANLV